jgi:formate hydrogenlyase subunit 6/NADH:ubiquinone oxidoreductase subunit I
MNFRVGHCQLQCTACGQVCPTGAIQRLSIEEKLGLGEFRAQGPVVLGTAHFDVGRCLPYSKNIPCVVCEEVCPTRPKAIHAERAQRMVRDGRKMVTAAGLSTVTLGDWPQPGLSVGRPVRLKTNQWQGDETTTYHLRIRHPDGTTETHRISGNDADTVMIQGRFARRPEVGAEVQVNLEYRIPKIDTNLCTGCGLCEKECPVVGHRRAIYVTAEGETRSRNYPQRDRNRSVRLLKTTSA